jgi:predicted enzyme related to lactoylglutathione lyase
MTAAPAAPAPPVALGRLVLLVRDYDEALAFYQAAFGAVVLFDATMPNGRRYLHVGLAPVSDGSAGVGFWFLQATDGDEALVGAQAGGQPLAVLYTPDCVGAVARCTAAGGRLLDAPARAAGATFAHVADLYGNEFVLVQGAEAAASPGVSPGVSSSSRAA